MRNRRALLGGVGAVVAHVAVLLIAPGFIDWTPYRDSFAAQLSRTAGRDVSIAGEVSFTILPRPAFSAAAVHVSGEGDALDIGRLSARLAFAPLLTGALQLRDLRLEDVTGTMSVGADWFAPASVSNAAPAPQEVPRAPFQLHVQAIEIVNGAVQIRDVSGTLADLANMDLRGRIDGRDAYAVTGALSVSGVDTAVELRIGSGGASGVRATSLNARLVSADATLTAIGRLALAKRTFEGDVTATGERGLPALAALGFSPPSRPALTKPFRLSAKVALDGTGVAFNAIALDVGGTAAKGSAEWRKARTPQLTTSFDLAPFALEDWLAAPQPAAQPAPSPAVSAPAPPVVASQAAPSLSADIVLRFPAVSVRGQGLRDGRLTAALANGELKINELAVTLPGTTRLAAFGLVDLGADTPALDGVVTLQTFDARGLLGWMGADVAGVPPGRLGSASFQAALQGTLNFLEFNDIEATLDTARISGRVSYAPRAQPFFGIDLRAENVNLDSYRGARPDTPAPAPGVATPAKPDVYGVTPTGTAFAGLGAFDADIHVELSGVTAGGLPGGRVGLDLGLKSGALEIRTASFEKIAGGTAWFSGAIAGLGTALQFNNVQFDLAGDDIARLAAALGVELPGALHALGPSSLIGTLNGGAMQADLTANLKAGGLTARATGQLMDIEKDPRFSGQIEAAHPRFSEVMRAAAYAWPANARDPGAFALQGRVVQESGKTVVSDACVSVGRDRVTGSAEVARVDGRNVVTARLTDIALDLDRVLPPETPPPAAPARGAAGSGPASPWSREPASWSFLEGWSGEVALAGPSLSARGLALQDFSVRVVVADGAAELADWQGKIFGAPGQLFLRLAAQPVRSVQGQLAVTRADFRALIAALNGGQTNLKSNGTADIVASFNTSGASAQDFANALSGTATLKISAAETGGGLTAGLLGPLSAAAQLDMTTPGKPAPITFSTRLSAAGGIVKLESAEVNSRSHTGSFAGIIDVPRKQVDLTGTLTPRKAGEDKLPIAIKGAMTQPNIRLLPPP